MAEPVLPEGYYLEHFLRFLENIRSTYGEFLCAAEQDFINRVLLLNESEQRLFVRLANRKGTVFFRSKLKYPELPHVDDVAQSLLECGFLRVLTEPELDECLGKLHKPALLRLLSSLGVESARNTPKPELLELAKTSVTFEKYRAHPLYQETLVRSFSDELSYLLFLAFGDLLSDLKLYALRDLGVLAGNGRGGAFTRRFASPEEARSEFLYRSLRVASASPFSKVSAATLDAFVALPPPIGAGASRVREKLLVEVSEALESAGELDAALTLLGTGKSARAVEMRIRRLCASGRKEEAKAELDRIIEVPESTELLFFAEDFRSRKFGDRRVSAVTRAFREAETIQIDARFRGQPEHGACEALSTSGKTAIHTENGLWRALFGIYFWDELFGGVNAAIHSEFDFLPADLCNGSFYERHSDCIKHKLSWFKDPTRANAFVRSECERHTGTPNGLFAWTEETGPLLERFLVASARISAKPEIVLLELAKDFQANKRGFPDLLLFEGEDPRFIEVKTLGDRLQAAQLRQLALLNRAGYPASILKVDWRYESNQVFVVIDLETTGGVADAHRITEISALKIHNGMLIDELTTLIHPERRIPAFIASLTGITNEMVADAPTFSSIAERLEEFLAGAIVVAHNVQFDLSFLASEFRREGKRFSPPSLCTRVEMRRLFPGLSSYGLAELCQTFGISLEQHHRARNDADAAAQLLKIILQQTELNREIVETPNRITPMGFST